VLELTSTAAGPGVPPTAIILDPGAETAGEQVRERLERLRELGVEVLAADGAVAADEHGPEPVLVLTDLRGYALHEALDRAIGAHVAFPEPVADRAWLLEVEGFDPRREREVESWLTVGNGRTGTRGSLDEGSEHSSPAVYVAGVYGRPDGELSAAELLPGPEWTRLAPQVGDVPLELDHGTVLDHRRVLDLRQGILFRFWRHRLPSGVEASFRSARFASLSERELLALEAELRAEGDRARLSAELPLPPRRVAESVDARTEQDRLLVEVRGAGGGAAAFAVSTGEADGRLERVCAVARGSADVAAARLVRAEADGPAQIRARHRAAWRERWHDADVVVEGDEEAQKALRFALYHLIAAGDPESDLASIGARALTGPGYNGHVFWDTEIFVLPFLVYTHPPTARALLAYRYRTLPAARARAEELGYRGALFAWESADTGEDETPAYVVGPDGTRVAILTGLQEHHISADVAWAVWRYWEATGDDVFMAEMGAEIVVETARFWGSRAERGGDGRYHVAPVIGPDEYHEDVRDNAYTNVLARWNLERALELAERDPGLAARLGLSRGEREQFGAVAAGLVDGFDPDTLLYEQFAGYFGLEDVRAAELGRRPFAGEVVLGRERLLRSQLVKQADVVMLAHVLSEVVPEEVARANYRYYEPRTSHGSSLSPAIHAALAARIGEPEQALSYFEMAAAIDLGDAMGNAAQGVHIATQGGMWQAAVLGFGGLSPEGEAVRLDPRLPRAWRRLAFPVSWRGTRLRVDTTPEELRLALDGPAAVAVGSASAQQLAAGRYRFRRTTDGWSPAEPER
jgi:trehalose/maltose hydrolase-like predicted phosphorylase